MPTYAVQYTYDERADVRDVVRPEHRAYLAVLADAGALKGSGPYVGGEPGALLVLVASDDEHLRSMLDSDPFQREGLVAATDVRAWDVVLGPWKD